MLTGRKSRGKTHVLNANSRPGGDFAVSLFLCDGANSGFDLVSANGKSCCGYGRWHGILISMRHGLLMPRPLFST